MTRILTRLEAELRAPVYLIVVDHGDVTTAYGDGIWLDAEAAADHWGEAIKENLDARVICFDLAKGTAREAIEVYRIISRRMRELIRAAE